MTAYNVAGLESTFSNEISYTVPVSTGWPPVMITSCAKLATGNMTIHGRGLTNQNCILLATSSLTPPVRWTPIATNLFDAQGLFACNDLKATNFARRFYRIEAVPVSAPPPPPVSTITIAADSGTLAAPFTSSNGIIWQTVTTTVTTGGRAAYTFTVTNAGNYTVSAQVNAPSEAANSFYVNIDAEPTDPLMTWDIHPLTTGFMSRTVSWRGNGTEAAPQYAPRVFALSAGTHQLIVRGRDGNTQLGTLTVAPYLLITNCAKLPTGNRAIRGTGVANQNCVLLAASSLTTPVVWTAIATNVSDAQGIFTCNDLQATNYASRFYRMELIPPSATPPPVGIIAFAADSGTLTAPFTANHGIVSQSVATGVTTGGRAAYTFTITNAGNYTISAVVNAADGGGNSFYLNIDAEPTDPIMIWDIYPLTTGFMSRTVSWRGNGTDITAQYAPKVFALSAGTHQLIVRGREADTQLGMITISPYLLITNCAKLSTGNLAIGGTGVANQTCVLLAASSLTAPITWTPIATSVSDAQGRFTFTDSQAANYARRFYRVQGQ